MKFFAILLAGISVAYNPLGASLRDFACARWLGNECSYWMRCYINGSFNRNHTEEGCVKAGLEFNGNACWARRIRGKLFGGNKNCPYLASTFCPRTAGMYYTCLKE
ncbi:hypothetical protein DSO57_1003168 [Entomophthora muscae]|uniref:Uncharacterized protein n=1 Tax=Entomophthora muscae TaxID=34485 RepID=A0ACC2SAB9_9FUNG|nr:hypothetical protein DSO57_1003168 [Entomophthora muscae]